MNTKEKEPTEEQTEQIIKWEAQALADSIGNALELNEEFLECYCSKELAEALRETRARILICKLVKLNGKTKRATCTTLSA